MSCTARILVLSILGALAASVASVQAEEPKVSARDLELLRDGVLVHPSSEVTWVEKVSALMRLTFMMPLELAPLYAYDRDLVCDAAARLDSFIGHEGTAAILIELESTIVALYRLSVADAYADARENWCGDSSDGRTWHFATSYRLADTTEAGEMYLGSYVSREVGRIDRKLADLRTRSEASVSNSTVP